MITRFSKKKLSAKEVISRTEGAAMRTGRKASRSEASATRITSRQIAPISKGVGQAPIQTVAVTALEGTIRA